MQVTHFIPSLIISAALLLVSSLHAAEVLPREEIDRLVKPVVDSKWAMGFVVGLVNEHDRQVIGYGEKSPGDPSPDGQSIFEIGSVSKTFAATLLAEAVRAGEVKLDDPVQKYLPPDVKMPAGERGRTITLLHLSTHSSGLPRMPTNFSPADVGNPYADYPLHRMYEVIPTLKLSHEPGDGECVYSNLGVALLGNVLAARAAKDYEPLLLNRVCQPLKMSSTRIEMNDAMRAKLAPPFDGDGGSLKNWDLNAFSPAGGIKSNVDDMLNYVSAEMGSTKTDLAAAMALTQKRQREFDAGNDIGLGWFISKKEGYHWHNGQTGGYHSFVAFDTAHRVGVVVLCNSAGNIPDLIGTRVMLRLLGKPADAPKLPQTIVVDGKLLDSYIGEYKLGLLSWITITRSKDHLVARVTGQEAFGIYPSSEKDFFWKVVNARLTFDAAADGKVKGLTLHQNGKDVPADKTK